VLKGDANPQEDSSQVDRQAVHGVGALRVPYVALPILWLHENAWGKLAAFVAVVLALVAALGLGRDRTLAVEADTDASGDGVDAAGPPQPETGGQGTSGEPTA
jgi:signal peptidase